MMESNFYKKIIKIAIVGYQARLGKQPQKYKIEQKGAERGISIVHREKEKWVTSAEFDKIIKKIGDEYYKKVFSPAIENLYNKGYSYDEVKKEIGIPSKIGAKVSLDQFLPYI
jgi:hypothetical protein